MGAPRRHATQGLEAPGSVRTKNAAWLLVAPDTPQERRFPINDSPLRIGTESGVEVLLTDPHVSRRHAEIVRTADGFALRDLGSRNGTHVEGLAIKEVLLRSGATITVGVTLLRFMTDAPPLTPRQPTPPPLPADTPPRFGEAVGQSEAMRHVFALLNRLGPTELTVLFIGETGTGKDVLARSMHAASLVAARPFVVFDCGAAAPSLIESELFGHERGAFTGASADRQGAFERAHGGTLFLDEVGELTLDLQPKLLRALDSRKVRRVGGSKEIPVDVRILAATNKNLEEEARAGRFREDLYFRLSAAVVSVPPLRARLEDLRILITAILAEGGYALDVSQETIDVLESYDWPGNVRELRNVILGAAALAEGRILEPRDLIFFRPRRRDPTIDKLPLAGRSLETIEKAAIAQTLRHCAGNKVKAAKALGIAPSTLYEKIKKYRL